MASTLRLPPLLGPSVSSSVRPHGRPADFALRLCLRCWLAPLASAQPSCRLPAPALDSGLAPLVSCPCLRPAFWPASLRRSGSRPCAFVLKRPCGMPFGLRRRRLAPAAPSGPRPGFRSSRPFPRFLRHRPEACASADCSSLAAFTSRGCQLPPACGSSGSRSSMGLRPSESALSPLPTCVWLAPPAVLEPAFRSCLGVPSLLTAGSRLHPALRYSVLNGLSGLRLRSHPSGAFRDRSCDRSFRPCLSPGPSGLAFRFRLSCAWLAPCTLDPSVQLAFASALDFRPPVFAPAPPRARAAD